MNKRVPIERLSMSDEYDPHETAIHLNRYAFVKNLCKDKVILDAGCGEGYGAYLMKSWGAKEVHGIDKEPAAIQKARELFSTDNLSFSLGDLEGLECLGQKYDLLVSFETIEHLDVPESFLGKINSVLSENGIVVISCPNDHYYYQEESQSNPFHKRKYNFFDFKSMCEKWLGDNVSYFLGFGLDGYCTVPIENSTLPEDTFSENLRSQIAMLSISEIDSAFIVKHPGYANHWNSSYFIGVWGATKSKSLGTGVYFPRPVFVQHQDEDIDLIRHVREHKSRENERIQYLTKIEEELFSSRLTSDRLSLLVGLLTEEKEAFLTLSQKYQAALNEATLELTTIKKTRGYRLLEKFREIVIKLRFFKIS